MEDISLLHYYEGICLYKMEDYDRALQMFQLSDEINPHFKTSEYIYHCHLKLGNMSSANAAIEKAYLQNPKNDKVAYLYAEMLSQKGEIINSESILKAILKKNPFYGPAVHLLNLLTMNGTK